MSNELQLLGQMDPSKLESEPWRVVTSMVIHADSEHLACNAIAGVACAALVASRAGAARAFSIALAGGASGNAMAAVLAPHVGVWVGASTAVFALLGAACSIYRSAALVLLTALVCFLCHAPGVNTEAHAAGAFCGLFLGLIIDADAKQDVALQAATAVLCVATVVACLSCANMYGC